MSGDSRFLLRHHRGVTGPRVKSASFRSWRITDDSRQWGIPEPRAPWSTSRAKEDSKFPDASPSISEKSIPAYISCLLVSRAKWPQSTRHDSRRTCSLARATFLLLRVRRDSALKSALVNLTSFFLTILSFFLLFFPLPIRPKLLSLHPKFWSSCSTMSSDQEASLPATSSSLSLPTAEPSPLNYAFLVHSQKTLTQNLPPRVDNKLLARQKRRRTRYVSIIGWSRDCTRQTDQRNFCYSALRTTLCSRQSTSETPSRIKSRAPALSAASLSARKRSKYVTLSKVTAISNATGHYRSGFRIDVKMTVESPNHCSRMSSSRHDRA